MIDWTATAQGTGQWLFGWVSTTDHVYEIWLDGIIIGTVTATGAASEYLFTGDGYTTAPPSIEVHDAAGDKAENEEYPPYAILQWRGLVGCGGYAVAQYISGVWTLVQSVAESGKGWYSYTTSVLDDDTEANFLVTALNSRGASGSAVLFDVTLVRNPAPPVVALVIDSGDLVMEAP